MNRPLDERKTSLTLLAALRGQNRGAWDRLIHLYGGLVYSWCTRRGLQPADAEDVTQEVFRTVFTRIRDFERDKEGSFRGWLLAITRNKLGDHLRRSKQQPQAIGNATESDPFDRLLTEAEDEASPATATMYRRAFDLIQSEFEEKSWQAFWLVVCEDKRPAEAAQELNLSLNAVYLAKSRILHRLREVLGDLPEPDARSDREN